MVNYGYFYPLYEGLFMKLLGIVGDLAVYSSKHTEEVYIVYGKHEGPILVTKEEIIGLAQLVQNQDLRNEEQ